MHDVATRTEGTVRANGIELAYETFGDRGAPPVVMIMGLGAQMIVWPDDLCTALADAGHLVVRFDNRDTGRSTHLAVPPPSVVDIVLRRRPPYTIGDMADDVVGLLDALDIGSAHLVGASMGGFIAQTVAIAHPDRVRSMTLIMTSTGSKLVGHAKLGVYTRLLRRRTVTERHEAITLALETFRVIGSTGFVFDEAHVADIAGRSFDRSLDPTGYQRQIAAAAAQPDRTAALRDVRVPTLVVHGLHDPLVGVSGGLAIARAVPGAKFLGYAGMGHDLPREIWPDLVREIGSLTARADAE